MVFVNSVFNRLFQWPRADQGEEKRAGMPASADEAGPKRGDRKSPKEGRAPLPETKAV